MCRALTDIIYLVIAKNSGLGIVDVFIFSLDISKSIVFQTVASD
jgi:hypothetical protein